ncbi:hypothetical protein BC629DRAFT_1471206 [Irpex lacteus]|nr:hypothetical protein BC629DRAFT_1471206 [Irpex lacteus]
MLLHYQHSTILNTCSSQTRGEVLRIPLLLRCVTHDNFHGRITTVLLLGWHVSDFLNAWATYERGPCPPGCRLLS